MPTEIIAVFSDTHSLLASFDAMLADAKAAGATRFWNLGDSAGYYMQPVEVVHAMQQLMHDYPQSLVLMGNHDAGICGLHLTHNEDGVVMKMNGQLVGLRFQGPAWEIAQEQQLIFAQAANKPALSWLKKLPLRANPLEGYFLAHGRYTGTDADSLWEYSTIRRTTPKHEIKAMQSEHSTFRMLAVGHSHVAGIWQMQDNGRTTVYNPQLKNDLWEQPFTFENLQQRPVLFNPGSISFPRQTSNLNAASYALLRIDTDNLDRIDICLRRVRFDADAAIDALPMWYPRRQPLIDELLQAKQQAPPESVQSCF